MIPSLRTVCITSDFLHSFHLELGSSVGSRSCCRCLSSDRRISRSTPQRTDVPVVPELASLVAFAERSILSMFFTCYLLVLFVFQFFFPFFASTLSLPCTLQVTELLMELHHVNSPGENIAPLPFHRREESEWIQFKYKEV